MKLKSLLTAAVFVLALASAQTASAIPAVSINITSPAAGSVHKTAPALSYTKTGVGTYQTCYHDNFEWYTEFCASGWVPGPLADGQHTYTAMIANSDDTEFDAESVSFTIDNTAPVVTIGGTPAAGYSQAQQINLDATVTDANPDKLDCKKDDEAWVGCGGTSTGGSIFVSFVASGETHTYSFRATDKAGNVTTQSRTVMIDRQFPGVSITTNWGNTTKDNSPAFIIGSTDSSPVTRTCRVLGQTAYTACPNGTFVSDVIADGDHTFQMQVVDAAGNVTTGQYPFTLDSTGPEYTLGTFAGDQTEDTTPTLTFNATDAHGVTEKCAIDPPGSDWNELVPCSGSFTPATPLALGDHSFFYIAEDDYGNVRSTIYAFKVVPVGTPLPGGPNGPDGGQGGSQAPAATVSVSGRSSKVKKGKFTNTVTVAIKPGTANCGGKVTLAITPGVKKAKTITKQVVVKNVKGACVGSVKLKLAAKLKNKKATVKATHAGTSAFAPVAFSGSLKKL